MKNPKVEFCPTCGYVAFIKDTENISVIINERYNLCPVCKSSIMPIMSDRLYKIISSFNSVGIRVTDGMNVLKVY